jgi:hypothetical protein
LFSNVLTKEASVSAPGNTPMVGSHAVLAFREDHVGSMKTGGR